MRIIDGTGTGGVRVTDNYCTRYIFPARIDILQAHAYNLADTDCVGVTIRTCIQK